MINVPCWCRVVAGDGRNIYPPIGAIVWVRRRLLRSDMYDVTYVEGSFFSLHGQYLEEL